MRPVAHIFDDTFEMLAERLRSRAKDWQKESSWWHDHHLSPSGMVLYMFAAGVARAGFERAELLRASAAARKPRELKTLKQLERHCSALIGFLEKDAPFFGSLSRQIKADLATFIDIATPSSFSSVPGGLPANRPGEPWLQAYALDLIPHLRARGLTWWNIQRAIYKSLTLAGHDDVVKEHMVRYIIRLEQRRTPKPPKRVHKRPMSLNVAAFRWLDHVLNTFAFSRLPTLQSQAPRKTT